MRVHAHQGDTVDAICHRYYGQTTAMVEAVLNANPDLARLGTVLPQGTPVYLPPVVAAPTQNLIQLWD